MQEKIAFTQLLRKFVNNKVRISINKLSDTDTSVKEIFDLITAKTDKLPEDYSTNFEHYLW